MSELLQMQETEILKVSPVYTIDQKKSVLSTVSGGITTNDYRKMRASKHNIFSSTRYPLASIETNYLLPLEVSITITEPSIDSWTSTVWHLATEEKDVKISSTLDSTCLVISKKIVKSFSRDVEKLDIVEDVFYNIEETPERPPGFIIEMLVVIPDSNRDMEYKIYASLGKLMRNNPEMLIDMHIIKRRGRKIKEVIPPEYQRCREQLEVPIKFNGTLGES